jgi:hypothetical protein
VSYRFRYVICCSPPELEQERTAFHAAIGKFNEEVAMKAGELLAAASLRPGIIAERQQAAIESNIRMCEMLVQIFGEQPPPAVFQGFVEYALRQAQDPAATMKRVAVLFRRAEAAGAESRDYQAAVAGRASCEVREFMDELELVRALREVLEGWYTPVRMAGS